MVDCNPVCVGITALFAGFRISGLGDVSTALARFGAAPKTHSAAIPIMVRIAPAFVLLLASLAQLGVVTKRSVRLVAVFCQCSDFGLNVCNSFAQQGNAIGAKAGLGPDQIAHTIQPEDTKVLTQ